MVPMNMYICVQAGMHIMHTLIFRTLALVTQIEKIFRFYVLYSRELNFSLCHMVYSSVGGMQANEETNKCFSIWYVTFLLLSEGIRPYLGLV